MLSQKKEEKLFREGPRPAAVFGLFIPLVG